MQPFAAFARVKYLSLATFRRSGVSVVTAVWFALDSGIIYVESGANAGKVKRVRNNPRVTAAPCTLTGKVTGLAVEARARVLLDDDEIAAAKSALTRKYGFVRSGYYGLLNGVRALRRKPKVPLDYLAITPA
jgi:PPOX class probable F420-dependent enzyme